MANPFHIRNDQPLTLAYALDDAFHFYYEDNLDFLRELNVQLVPFSPLKDKELPAADAYYFGGGFPEVYAQELMANTDSELRLRKLTSRAGQSMQNAAASCIWESCWK